MTTGILWAFACQTNEMKGKNEGKEDNRYCDCDALQSNSRASLSGVIHFNQELQAWYILGPVNEYTNPNVYLPCNLADSLKVEDLEVIFSGIPSLPLTDLSAFEEYGSYFCIKLLSVEYDKPYFFKEILGKWELQEINDNGEIRSYEPTGYVEYLKDSLLGWYDYETEEYVKVDDKYWVDSLIEGQPVPYRLLHYTKRYYTVPQYPYRPDNPTSTVNFICHFIGDNQMTLQTIDNLLLYGETDIYIYKRIK